MKTRLLKRLRKNAKKRVFLALLSDGEFVVKSDIGWYSQRLATYCFASKFGNAVFTMQLHEAEKILSDARRLYMRIQLVNLKRKKYQKIIKKL
jgi:hypothetical protein